MRQYLVDPIDLLDIGAAWRGAAGLGAAWQGQEWQGKAKKCANIWWIN